MRWLSGVRGRVRCAAPWEGEATWDIEAKRFSAFRLVAVGRREGADAIQRSPERPGPCADRSCAAARRAERAAGRAHLGVPLRLGADQEIGTGHGHNQAEKESKAARPLSPPMGEYMARTAGFDSSEAKAPSRVSRSSSSISRRPLGCCDLGPVRPTAVWLAWFRPCNERSRTASARLLRSHQLPRTEMTKTSARAMSAGVQGLQLSRRGGWSPWWSEASSRPNAEPTIKLRVNRKCTGVGQVCIEIGREEDCMRELAAKRMEYVQLVVGVGAGYADGGDLPAVSVIASDLPGRVVRCSRTGVHRGLADSGWLPWMPGRRAGHRRARGCR